MSQTPIESTGAPEAARFVALIDDQVREEARQRLADAEARAERVRRTAEEEVEALRARAARDGAASGRRLSARLLAETEAALHRDWLWAREQLIDAVLHDAAEQLATLASWPDANDVLAALVKEALAHLPPGPVRVSLPEDCMDLVPQADVARFAQDRWEVEYSAVSIPGCGVVASTPDGRLRFDNSFEARLQRSRAAIRRHIAACLFQR